MPHWLEAVIYPIDKVNLDVLRFAHFLALAALTVHFVPARLAGAQIVGVLAAIVCGQHSLEIFCLGVFLSFAGHFAMVEISSALWVQILVSLLGILIMIAAAALITWYKSVEGRSPGSPGSRPKQRDADLAGGEA